MPACSTCGKSLGADRMLCGFCGNFTTAGAAGTVATEKDFVDACDVKAESTPKIITGEWWDEAWGGTNPGFMPSECVLVTGAPGTGKSTLLILIGFAFAKVTGKSTYFVSAEQTKEEWKTYLDRMNLPLEKGMFRVLNAMGSGGQIDEAAFKAFPPGLLILDSVTALCGKDRDAQVVVCDNYKKNYSAKYKCPSLIISHINKEGDLAGLMTMQHNVDGICSLFPNDKERSRYAGQPVFEFHKHRFGPCHKEYQLIMAGNGLYLAPPKEKMKAGGDALLAELNKENAGDVKAMGVEAAHTAIAASSMPLSMSSSASSAPADRGDEKPDDDDDDDDLLDEDDDFLDVDEELDDEDEEEPASRPRLSKKPKDAVARDIGAVIPKKIAMPIDRVPKKPTAAERAAEVYRKKLEMAEAKIRQLEAARPVAKKPATKKARKAAVKKAKRKKGEARV